MSGRAGVAARSTRMASVASAPHIQELRGPTPLGAVSCCDVRGYIAGHKTAGKSKVCSTLSGIDWTSRADHRGLPRVVANYVASTKAVSYWSYPPQRPPLTSPSPSCSLTPDILPSARKSAASARGVTIA
jgi:hypothetical protein